MKKFKSNNAIKPIYTVKFDVRKDHIRPGRIPSMVDYMQWYVVNTKYNTRISQFFSSQLEAMKFADVLYRKLQA